HQPTTWRGPPRDGGGTPTPQDVSRYTNYRWNRMVRATMRRVTGDLGRAGHRTERNDHSACRAGDCVARLAAPAPPRRDDRPIAPLFSRSCREVGVPLVSIEGVSKSFGDHRVLTDINLAVEAGEVVVVIGPS